MMYDFECRVGITRAMVATDPNFHVLAMSEVPIQHTDVAALERGYEDAYQGCTRFLVYAVDQGEDGVVIQVVAMAIDGSSPDDTPLYEIDGGGEWKEVYTDTIRAALMGTLVD